MILEEKDAAVIGEGRRPDAQMQRRNSADIVAIGHR
jgi:hypothetical protein